MNLIFFVEEPSMETLLRILLPKIVLQDFDYQIIVFQGKPDLLQKLESRLRGYAPWITEEYRILVLVDRDNDDCRQLKKKLDAISRRAGLVTKTNPIRGRFQVINRIVIEELEAWYFGDPLALHNAYPKLPMSLHRNSRYRNPDSIANGTWENLERILQRAGYFPSGLSKIQLASEIGPYMTPSANRSESFQMFQQGLLSCFK